MKFCGWQMACLSPPELRRAVTHFRKKFGKDPELLCLPPSASKLKEVKIREVEIQTRKAVPKGHLFMGPIPS